MAALTQSLAVERHTDLAQHRVQFYQNEPFLVRCVAEHLAESLRNGGSALILATKDHRGRILEALSGMRISPDALIRRCIALDAGEALPQFMLHDAPDPSRFRTLVEELLHAARSSSESALTPIAAFGEMVAVLWSKGKGEAAVQVEQLWRDFTRDQSLSLLCAYPMAHFSRRKTAASSHKSVMRTRRCFPQKSSLRSMTI